MIHIALCFTDQSGEYYRHSLVTVQSVLAHCPSAVSVHLVHDETLTDEARGHIELLASRHPHASFFLHPASVPEDVSLLVPPRLSKGTLYRLLLPDLLPEVDRLLYLDSDVVCQCDIAPYFDTDLQGAVFGASPRALTDGEPHYRKWGIRDGRYVNCGVLLMDLSALRRAMPDFAAEALDLISKEKLHLFDQDAINILFREGGQIHLMPEVFNFRMASLDNMNLPFSDYQGKILHYNGPKPWTTFYPAALPYWQQYATLFGADEALRRMAETGPHESAPLYSYLLRHEKAARWIKRLAQIESMGLCAFLRSRLQGKKRKS